MPAVPTAVAQLRAAVGDVLTGRRWPAPAVRDVSLAVSEASSNVVLHAYRDAPGTDPVIRLRVAADAARAEVWVEDAGAGMRRGARAANAGMGLGLPIIGALSAGFEIDASDDLGGCRVRMLFER